jgi:LemA protein
MEWVLLGLAALLAIYLVATYNGLINLKNQVANAWKQIDVQLQRRHDLIPNLVNAVRGYMEFERDTLERVMAARARAVAATGAQAQAQAEGELTQALGRLFAVVENYPDLKANQNVLQLQEELTTTENQLGFARQLYNDLVMRYNIKQTVFPTNFFARSLGFTQAEYFEVPEAARAVPQVDLSLGRQQATSSGAPPSAATGSATAPSSAPGATSPGSTAPSPGGPPA